MKKKWHIIVGIVVVILLLVGVGVYVKKRNGSIQTGITEFTSIDNSFSVEYPKNRTVQYPSQTASSIIATFVNEETETVGADKPYINIAKGALAGDLDAVYADALGKYKKLFRNVQVVSENDFTVDGRKAKRFIFDATLGGNMVRYQGVFIDDNGVIYTITAASAPSDAEKSGADLQKILSSWKFIK